MYINRKQYGQVFWMDEVAQVVYETKGDFRFPATCWGVLEQDTATLHRYVLSGSIISPKESM